jgi:hypothetical protein
VLSACIERRQFERIMRDNTCNASTPHHLPRLRSTGADHIPGGWCTICERCAAVYPWGLTHIPHTPHRQALETMYVRIVVLSVVLRSLLTSYLEPYTIMSTRDNDNGLASIKKELHQPWKRSDLWAEQGSDTDAMAKQNRKLTAIEIISAAASGPVAGQGITVKLFFE